MAYSNTNVTYGRGEGIVVGTGMTTEVGKIATMLNDADETDTPLKHNLNQLGKTLTIMILAICVIVFIVGVLKANPADRNSTLMINMFLVAISLAVAAIPEGLPAIVTIILALGTQAMPKHKAIVRKLPAVETLGATDIICSDKTGTLTQNQMTIHYIWTPAGEYQVTGNGYVNNGQVELKQKQLWYEENPDLHKLVQIAALDNDTSVQSAKEGGKPKILGTPTEAALTIMAQKAGFDKQKVIIKYPRLRELPFDSDRKRMSTIHHWNDTQYIIFTKGSYSDTIKECNRIQINGKVRKMTDEDRARAQKANAEYAARGLRSMALA